MHFCKENTVVKWTFPSIHECTNRTSNLQLSTKFNILWSVTITFIIWNIITISIIITGNVRVLYWVYHFFFWCGNASVIWDLLLFSRQWIISYHYIILTIKYLKKLLLNYYSFLNTCKTHFDQSGKDLPEYENQTQICWIILFIWMVSKSELWINNCIMHFACIYMARYARMQVFIKCVPTKFNQMQSVKV